VNRNSSQLSKNKRMPRHAPYKRLVLFFANNFLIIACLLPFWFDKIQHELHEFERIS
jgi:hypothetical protein